MVSEANGNHLHVNTHEHTYLLLGRVSTFRKLVSSLLNQSFWWKSLEGFLTFTDGLLL